MEHEVSEFLINSWAAILTLMLTVYVALDGFDLGIGVLSLVERDKTRKNLMMEGLNGIWDANETWLVLMGGALFGAFPLAYAAVLQTLYIPVLLMLFALIFRGVAFEFRLYSSRPELWVLAFGIGSMLATLAQGLVLGALLSGIEINDAGSPVSIFSWISPFSILTALVLLNVYLVLGATYLLGKVEGDFIETIYRWAWVAALSLVILLPIFFYGMGQVYPDVSERWLAQPLWYGILGFCVDLSLLLMIIGLIKKDSLDPFFWSIVSVIMAVIGLVASYYPYLVPGYITLHGAASSTRTLEFMLMAVGGLLPLMLAYNAYQYYVFRGRVRLEH